MLFHMLGLSVMLGVSLLLPAQANQAAAERLFGSAIEAQQRGDLAAAIRDYMQVLKLTPKMIDARVNLGAALAQTGRLDDAIAQYRVALEQVPDNAEIRMNLGLAFYKKNDLPDAIAEFERVRTEQPQNAQLAILLGDSEVQTNRSADAVAMLGPLEAANAGNPDFEYVLGRALLANGRRRDGAERLQRAADATHAPDTYFLAGSVWLDLNEAELSRKDLEVAAKATPPFPRIQTLLGMARDHTSDPEQAEVAFRAALRTSPDEFDANLYLGAILLKRRDLASAKPFLDRAVALNPTSNMARYESARWQSTSGDYARAVTELEAVEKAQPDWLEPHVELATVYYKLHRPEDGARERAIVAKLTAQQQAKGPGR